MRDAVPGEPGSEQPPAGDVPAKGRGPTGRAGARRILPWVGFAAVVLLAGTGVAVRLTAVPRGIASAERALEAGDLAQAEAAWRGVLAEDPVRLEALYGLGWTLHLAGQVDLARASFQQCVAVHPDSELGYKGLGSVAMSEGNVPLARRRFEEALARAPDDPAIRHSLALLDLGSGRVEEAIAALEALSAEAPEAAAFQQGLAEALLAAGRSEEALDAAGHAIARAEAPRDRALAWFTRARALLAVSGGRVDPEDCAATAPPIFAWLEEADRALDQAEDTGVPLPELVVARRTVRQRRGAVDDLCPGVRARAPQAGRKSLDE